MYRVYDYYNGRIKLVDEFESYRQAAEAAIRYINKSKGNCDIDIVDVTEEVFVRQNLYRITLGEDDDIKMFAKSKNFWYNYYRK